MFSRFGPVSPTPISTTLVWHTPILPTPVSPTLGIQRIPILPTLHFLSENFFFFFFFFLFQSYYHLFLFYMFYSEDKYANIVIF